MVATAKIHYTGGMVNVADTPRSWSDAPFRYIAGHVALDLVNTVDWTAAGLVEDRLNSYERLVEWSVGAKLVSARTAERLCAHATRRMTGAARVLRDARALRHAIRRLVLARLGHEAADPSLTADAALASLSRMARAASMHHQLAIVRRTGAKRSAPAIDWVWTGLDDAEPPLDLIVWMAAHAAAALVSSASVDRWGVCPGATCGWLFMDTTRNGQRRWCEMATCGTRAKDRRRRGPLRARPTPGGKGAGR